MTLLCNSLKEMGFLSGLIAVDNQRATSKGIGNDDGISRSVNPYTFKEEMHGKNRNRSHKK